MAARGSNGRSDPADAIVVGGGMVGGTLALALAAGGLAVTLVDRTPLPAMAAAAYDGRASAVAYASQRLLAQIGLWREVEHAAEPILDIRVSDGASSLFLHYDHRELGGTLEGAPFGWIVENGAIRRGLAALLEAAPNVQVVAPARAARLEPGDPVAELTLADGAVLAAPLIVAADGTDSLLRGQTRIAAAPWRFPQDG
ncbi:MAG: FAD-dependent oxidoreductase, partial [Rhodospirillaceae bacterium]|nr:FAD-dependent oxidoreductase [Rhodospirillaceae bacterium]